MARRIEVIDLDSDDGTNTSSRAPWDTSEVESLFEELNQGELDLYHPQAMNDERIPGFDVAHGFAHPFAHRQDSVLGQQRIGESVSAQHAAISSVGSGIGFPEDHHSESVSPAYGLCLAEILELFPDISHDHVEQLYNSDVQNFKGHGSQNSLVQHLTEKILDSGKYPKEKDRLKELKRKRYRDSDEELAELQNAQSVDIGHGRGGYASYAKTVLQEEFINVPSRFIDLKFRETGQFIKTYQALEVADRDWETNPNPPYQRLKHPRKPVKTPEDIEHDLDTMAAQGYGVAALKREIAAARRQREKEEAKRQSKKVDDAAEQAKDKEYLERGDVMDCSICWDSTPTYKVIACNSEKTPHFTCFGCIRDQAKSSIGDQKWELLCPDTSGCQASFSRSEKKRALSAKTLETLDRIQQQSELAQASMADLSRCPFCDFAAVCPSIDVDWEFRCGNPECERVTCRRCDKETHAPYTCKEARENQGLNERHAIEEARTAAIIKHCACGRPIVKLDGCNKVKCYCGRTICDFCGEDVTSKGYNHFASEGGFTHKVGLTCPLYDDNVTRNAKNIQAAEERAKKKIREENPDLSEADLEIKFKKDTSHGLFPGHTPFMGRHHNPLPPVPPRVAAGPLHHDFPQFPGNGAGLGYGPPIVGPPIVGPPVHPQNARHSQNMVDPMYLPYNPPAFPVLGPPIMGHYGERKRHGAAVPPHRIPEGNHHERPLDADRRAVLHPGRHALRADEGFGIPERVDQRLKGGPSGTKHTRGDRQATTAKLAIPGSMRREKG